MKLESFRKLSSIVLVVATLFAVSFVSAKTPPVPPAVENQSVSFLIIGDWGREGQHNQTDVASQMGIEAARTHAKFTIVVGDNFYEQGVQSVTDPHWQKSYEAVYTASSLQHRWNVVLGNHDYYGSPQPQIDYTKLSKRWYMPARYYSEEINLDGKTTALFVYLDTNPFIKNYYQVSKKYGDHLSREVSSQDTAAQLRWLDSLLANNKSPWKFVSGHHTVYSGGTGHGNTEELVEKLAPRFEKYGVQAYICGHDHDLQYLTSVKLKTHFIVSGAGSKVRKAGNCEMTKFSVGESGFVSATLTPDELHLNYIDWQGKLLYATTISR